MDGMISGNDLAVPIDFVLVVMDTNSGTKMRLIYVVVTGSDKEKAVAEGTMRQTKPLPEQHDRPWRTNKAIARATRQALAHMGGS
jgi:hypothetical protein